MVEIPRAIDLLRVAEKLGRNQKYRNLVGAIRRTYISHSCLQDIVDAADCLPALWKVSEKFNFEDQRRRTIEASLLNQALLLYIRATHAGSKHGSRGSILVRKHLPENVKPVHDQLIIARNKALAHVHLNAEVAGSIWHRAIVVLLEDASVGWQLTVTSAREAFPVEVARNLFTAVPVVKEILDRQFTEAFASLETLLRSLEGDAQIYKVFDQSLRDYTDVVGNRDAAMHLVNNREDEFVSYRAPVKPA